MRGLFRTIINADSVMDAEGKIRLYPEMALNRTKEIYAIVEHELKG